MPHRIALSLSLVVSVLISPWLVGDWFAENRRAASGGTLESTSSAGGAQAGEHEEGGLRIRARGLERGRAKLAAFWRGGGRGEGAAAGASAGESSAVLELAPFPLAANESRVIEAHHDSVESPRRRFSWASLGRGLGLETVQIPESERSREAVAAAEQRLAGALAEKGIQLGSPLFLRLFKEEGELEVWLGSEDGGEFVLLRSYDVAALSGRPGPKKRDGDGQVPEGFYALGAESLRPTTRHFLGLDLGYPNAHDRYHNRTGGEILIHGGQQAWGAVALAEEAMGEVYALAEAALREGREALVAAFPFRMEDRRMEQEWRRSPEWIDFWVNLKEGYDFFENVKSPPFWEVEQGRYVFRIPSRS